MTGAVLAALAIAAQAPSAVPAEFVAGRGAVGNWRMEAVTVVNGPPLPPMIGNSRCTVTGPGLRLVVPREYGGSFEIGGRGAPFAMADIVAVELGGIAYEARVMPFRFVRGRYSDVDYPPGHVDPDSDAPALIGLGVRRAPEHPWLDLPVLLDDVLQVRSLGIRYRTGSGEAQARLSVAGLGRAINWCQRAFRSRRARTLPGQALPPPAATITRPGE